MLANLWVHVVLTLHQAVQKLDYKLSKPYGIKLFDAKIQTKVSFCEIHAAAHMLGKQCPELSSIMDADDLREFTKERAETIVLTLVRDFLKSQKSLKKKCEHQAVCDNVNAFLQAAGAPSNLESLVEDLEMLYSVLNAQYVPITRLQSAVDSADAKRSAAGDDEVVGAILKFLFSEGASLLAEAETTCGSRKTEKSAEAELEELLKEGKVIESNVKESMNPDSEPVSELEHFAAWYQKCLTAKKGKKKQEGGFTNQQKTALNQAMTDLMPIVAKHVLADLQSRLGRAMDRAIEAFGSKGYVSDTALGQNVPLTQDMQEKLMSPEAISNSQAFSALVNVQPILKNWSQGPLTSTIAKVMAGALHTTEAYTALGQNGAMFECDANAAKVNDWLTQVGVEKKVIDKWNQILGHCRAANPTQLMKASELLRQYLKQEASDDSANWNKEATNNILTMLPPRAPLSICLKDFFALMKSWSEIAQQGSLAKPVKCQQVFNAGDTWIRKYTAQDEKELQLDGFDYSFEEVKKAVEAIAGKAEGIMKSHIAQQEKNLTEFKKKADRIYTGVPTDKVDAFKAKMKKDQTKMLSVGTDLKKLCQDFKTLLPDTGTEGELTSGQELYRDASLLQNKMVEYVII